MLLNQNSKIHEIFIRWGWLVVVLLCLHLTYINAIQNQLNTLNNLDHQLENLYTENKLLECKQKDLKMQVNSQSDPAWIQRTLMRCLGLVPKGQKKVFFDSPSTLD